VDRLVRPASLTRITETVGRFIGWSFSTDLADRFSGHATHLCYTPPVDLLTRATLIRRIRDGNDRPAWDEFCRLYQPLVRVYVGRFRLQDHDAADLSQDIFTKLHGHMARFDLDHGKGKFRGWLRSFTDNRVRDWLRARSREKKLIAPIPAEEIAAAFAETAENETRRRLEWQRAVFEVVLKQVRDEFKERKKVLACFELTTLGGRPAKDAAALLGIGSVNTVYVYAHRVLQRARDLCGEYDEDLNQVTEAHTRTD
jgi:RNA polymerase sigma factor (sigma-70 family)